MRRFATMLGLALVSCAVLSTVAQAQVIGVQITRPYTPIYVQPSYLPPVYVNPPGAVNYYPLIAPSYPATLNLYPQSTATISYYAPPAPVSPVVVPGGVYTTYTYQGYGIFRPRGVYSQTYYTPVFP